ncbi:MAG: CYTH domain-containing protein [Lachnospiraceae bacterium]|nr:CYTH domain-containing protein [Lachnospiraceae bacterium]
MEIERKFTIKQLPADLERYPFHIIEQAYLTTDPVIRVRREDDSYYMTYKGKGTSLAHEEYNLPLTKEAYDTLKAKADGNLIAKKRYLIPIKDADLSEEYKTLLKGESLMIELDIFEPPFAPLIIAEVEFPSVEAANAYIPADWFLEDVTDDPAYHNAKLSRRSF